MENNIFQRHEVKYLVDSRQRALIEQAFRMYMAPDPHGESTICNVYYDTPDYRLIRHSLEKPVYKEKLRMRSYGTVSDRDTVFLELKKKYRGVVYKRRIQLPQWQAEAYMAGRMPLLDNSQIGRRCISATTAAPTSPKRMRTFGPPSTKTSAGAART